MAEDSDLQRKAREYVRHVVMSTVTAKSNRDMQRMPGPSDLSDECDYCLALCLARAAGLMPPASQESFSFKAWTGTALHEKLEREIPRHFSTAVVESKVRIGEIEGLGEIFGHIDLRFDGDHAPAWAPELAGKPIWVDHKTKNLADIRMYKKKGVPTSHAWQMLLYGLGLRRMGIPVEVGVLVYYPRDSNRAEDIWESSCVYREDVPLGLLRRAETLLYRVRHEGVGDIASDPGCWDCRTQRRVAS